MVGELPVVRYSPGCQCSPGPEELDDVQHGRKFTRVRMFVKFYPDRRGDNFFEKDVMSNKNLKPGETAPASGQYGVNGPRGGRTSREVTLQKGDTVPPIGKSGSTVTLVDRTKNKSGRG
jgi:hypothetical protein